LFLLCSINQPYQTQKAFYEMQQKNFFANENTLVFCFAFKNFNIDKNNNSKILKHKINFKICNNPSLQLLQVTHCSKLFTVIINAVL